METLDSPSHEAESELTDEMTSLLKRKLSTGSSEDVVAFPSVVENMDSESEISYSDEAENELNADNADKAEERISKAKHKDTSNKKRKKYDPTKRRKIRKLLTESKLQSETIEAIRQEEERRKRLEEQALRSIQALKSENTTSTEVLTNTDSYPHDYIPKPTGVTAASTYLTSLLTSQDVARTSESNLLINSSEPAKQLIPTPQLPNKVNDADVICISSDSEEDKVAAPAPKSETIDLSSDSSDDVICTGEVKEETELEDVNNSGMHIEDAKNQRDSQGRVLVNVNRPSSEPEIFLAPQLAAAVLPHQIGGIRFMYDNIVETLSHYKTSPGFGCILAHSMGLGKTLQVISFVDIFVRFTEARTVLCVVPVNTLMNWVSEFNMWLPLKSKCLDENPASVWPRAFTVHILSDNHKTVDARSKVVSQWYDEGGVLLLGYEMYRQLTSRKQRKRRKKKIPKPNETIDLEEEDRLSNLAKGMQESLLKPGPDLIICDEGHRIKNSHASISQMLKNVRTRRRIVLTGYPLQNNLMEYWCMVDFVRPNFLGTKQEFSNMFERPILNGQCADSNESDIRLMRFRSHVLHSLLKGFVQRRSHSVLQDTLPFKEEHVFMIRLSQWQKKLYNKFWETKMIGGSGSWCSSVNPIKAFSVCCKIWNHPDVLFRTVQERAEDNAELDPDLDLPDTLDNGMSSGRKTRQKSPVSSESNKYSAPSFPSEDSLNSFSSLDAGDVSAFSSAPPPPSVLQTPAAGPFGDEKDKRLKYDWAKELLVGYQTGIMELSGKMVVLMELINLSLQLGDRVLVFSQSLCTLTLIEDFLSKQHVPKFHPDDPDWKWSKNENYFRLDGNTHSAEREKMINQFNSPDNKHFKLFLLSTRAGCLGINLIGANRVIVFDASWNPCHDAQAVCRVYRYGQQKTCHIYRLVCDQVMEKKIYERQVTKQGMSDRVVDKLNPTQVFTKQDVLSLMVYSNEELPYVDFSTVEDQYNDPVLIKVCKSHGAWFTKKPFTHESLLLDCKDQRLTKAEKRLAEKGYEKDKLASSAYNYGRQSYAGFYGSSARSNNNTSTNNNAVSSFPSSLSHDQNRPIANVRPMQSTPLPANLQQQNGQSSTVLHKNGIAVQKVVATMDIPLPPQQTLVNSLPGSQPTKIHAGESICVIRGKKGTYIRTSQGRIFAVRLNDNPRFTNAQSDTATRLSYATSTVSSPSPSITSTPTSNPTAWIDLNQTKSQSDHMIPQITPSFSSSYSPRDNIGSSIYNHLNMAFPAPYMPLQPQYTPSSINPVLNFPFPSSTYSNQMSYPMSIATSYTNSDSSAAINYSKAYRSMAAASSPMDTSLLNTSSSSNIQFMDFSKGNSIVSDRNATLSTSYSAPTLRNPESLDDWTPMDLSNPCPTPAVSSQESVNTASSVDNTGLEFNIPFTW